MAYYDNYIPATAKDENMVGDLLLDGIIIIIIYMYNVCKIM